jgi:2-polyprenyl-3-methyl-5-hydroxy-6-metoxy-1,4-benzoquinol methylase
MKAEIADKASIRSAPRPNCALCGSEGRYVHLKQQDRLFEASGFWNFKKCCNRRCGLIWLDPMPLDEDIANAYVSYYTHAVREGGEGTGLLRRAFRFAKRGYQAGKYGYRPISLGSRIAGTVLYLFPVRRGEVDAEVRFLRAVPQGRLLDVGCGSGEWIASMQKRDWNAEGVDFDQHAVDVARQAGLDVRCGSLEQQGFSSDSFDAVTLNHVIEHLPDPVRSVAECARIMKPTGKLVLLTPNGASLGHSVFKQNWRGLEPPRHLHIFSIPSLCSMLKLAGLSKLKIYPQIAKSVVYESLILQQARVISFASGPRDWRAWLCARLFASLEFCLVKIKPSLADCIAVVAMK